MSRRDAGRFNRGKSESERRIDRGQRDQEDVAMRMARLPSMVEEEGMGNGAISELVR